MERKVIAEAVDDRRRERYVLCWLPGRFEFASWLVAPGGSEDGEDSYCLGRYFPDLRGAVEDFRDRVHEGRKTTCVDWKVPAHRWNEARVVLHFELD